MLVSSVWKQFARWTILMVDFSRYWFFWILVLNHQFISIRKFNKRIKVLIIHNKIYLIIIFWSDFSVSGKVLHEWQFFYFVYFLFFFFFEPPPSCGPGASKLWIRSWLVWVDYIERWVIVLRRSLVKNMNFVFWNVLTV